MILFYMPGACSLSTHISLLETGEQFRLVKVNHKTLKTEHGENFLSISPDGRIPVLKLPTDDVITDCVGTLHYIADHFWQSGVSPAPDSAERARLNAFLTRIEHELHAQFSLLQQKRTTPDLRDAVITRLSDEFEKYEKLFSDGRHYLMGRQFSVADAYLLVAINWAGMIGINTFRWPHIGDFGDRMRGRTSVLAALRAEGLLVD
ncbi:hypothetical protein LF95_01300 [Thalassospira sp. TSL5-1]|nr:hypothetical protein LF95_01300 [Thalassospira sp. TSL5-1]